MDCPLVLVSLTQVGLYNLLMAPSEIVVNAIKWQKCTKYAKPSVVARLEVRPLGMQAGPSLIPTFGTFFRGDLVMKKISMAILSVLLIQEE